MDKNTFSEYGWIVIILIFVTSILIFIPALTDTVTENSNKQIESHFVENSDASVQI